MHTLIPIADISQRAKRIRLPPKALATRAGRNFATLYRGFHRPGSTTVGNLEAFSAALVGAERELRDYLNALHPPEADGPSLARAAPALPQGESGRMETRR